MTPTNQSVLEKVFEINWSLWFFDSKILKKLEPTVIIKKSNTTSSTMPKKKEKKGCVNKLGLGSKRFRVS
jgi:hypothetical protein